MSAHAASHRIRNVSIRGGFLDGAQFELADGLNCFIGARGAGKTTVVELIRYALDALPSRDSHPVDRRRIETLVERNLAGGRVDVTIETKDGLNVRQAGGDATQVVIEVQVAELLTIEVARHLIVMTLANVLKNALEACIALAGERDGVVQIVAAQQEGAVEIRISDNGIGMSQEEKIGWSEFIPGRRNKSKRLSTGYGLPIAVRNLAAHGGTLTLESTEDVETIVTIRIPVDSDE
ncbi:MAG: AAA family ATPase [Pirellulaceae bacterium]